MRLKHLLAAVPAEDQAWQADRRKVVLSGPHGVKVAVHVGDKGTFIMALRADVDLDLARGIHTVKEVARALRLPMEN